MKHIIYILSVIVVWWSAIWTADAQQARVRAWLDSTYVIVGMPTTIHLQSVAPEGLDVAFPDVVRRGGVVAYDDSASFLLELGDVLPRLDTLVDNGMTTLSQDVEVFCFDSAALFIPPFQFVTGRGDTLETNSLALRVVVPFDSIVVDPEQFVGLKDVIAPEFVLMDYVWWVLAPLCVLLLVVACYFAWLYYRRHRSDAPVEVRREKPLPPHVVAMAALDALAAKKLWQNGRDKQYQSELTDILRQYIEARFEVAAMEKTTSEILDELYELAETQKASLVNLKQVLTMADLVKFAKYVPLADESQLSFMNAKMFVEQTKRTELPDGLSEDTSATEAQAVE